MEYKTPYADVVPPLAETEYNRLRSDIHQAGMVVPILVDEYHNVIDGHHRLKIAAELGIDNFPVEIRAGMSDSEKRLLAWTINANRRQLSPEDMIASRTNLCAALREDGMSLRAIADTIGISHEQVRQDLSGVKSLDTSLVEGRDGKHYPSIRTQHNEADRTIKHLGQTPVAQVCRKLDVNSTEKIAILDRLHKSSDKPDSNGTFDEIDSTGGFAYGDDMEKWCNFSKATVEEISTGLRSLSDHHRIMAGQNKPHQTQGTANEEWYTPQWIIDKVRIVMGAIDLDPMSCAEANKVVGATRYYTIEDDGLSQPWWGRVFMNPPYTRGMVDRCIDKLKESNDVQEFHVLVNNATETEWGQRLMHYSDAVCFLKGRVKFWGSVGSTPLQGQALFYGGPAHEYFCKVFEEDGETWKR